MLSGKKIREGRIMSGMFKNIQKDSVMKFWSSGTKAIFAYVTNRVCYRTFEDMLRTEGVMPFLPDQGYLTVKQAVDVYHSFPKYADKERQHGVVSFHIDVNIPQEEAFYKNTTPSYENNTTGRRSNNNYQYQNNQRSTHYTNDERRGYQVGSKRKNDRDYHYQVYDRQDYNNQSYGGQRYGGRGYKY